MSDDITDNEPTIGPRTAIAHLKTLIRAALKADDIKTVQKLLNEMMALVDKVRPKK